MIPASIIVEIRIDILIGYTNVAMAIRYAFEMLIYDEELNPTSFQKLYVMKYKQ